MQSVTWSQAGSAQERGRWAKRRGHTQPNGQPDYPPFCCRHNVRPPVPWRSPPSSGLPPHGRTRSGKIGATVFPCGVLKSFYGRKCPNLVFSFPCACITHFCTSPHGNVSEVDFREPQSRLQHKLGADWTGTDGDGKDQCPRRGPRPHGMSNTITAFGGIRLILTVY